jgi:hypothetical protein
MRTDGKEAKLGRELWVFAAYAFAFIGVYSASLLYAILPNVVNMGITWTNSSASSVAEGLTYSSYAWSANTTMTNSYTASFIPLIAIVLMAVVVISFLIGAFSMGKANE